MIGLSLENFIDSVDAVCEAGTVRNLDIESGSRIHFQDQRSVLAIDDDVDAEVAEPGDLTTARRRLQYEIPVKRVR